MKELPFLTSNISFTSAQNITVYIRKPRKKSTEIMRGIPFASTERGNKKFIILLDLLVEST